MQRQSSYPSTVVGTVPVENKVWYLKQSRLFERASDETIGHCEHLFVQHLCPKGNVLFEQGDAARLVYLIKRGTVRIVRRTADGKEITVAILGAGCLFGEEVVFSNVERTTLAICMTPTLLCTARAEHVYGLLGQFPALAINVAKYVNERREEALAIVEDFAYLTVPERLLNLFDRLRHDYGEPVVDGTLLNIRLTHAEIASLIGSTRETVSTQFSQLVRDGRVRIEGHSIVVLIA